MADINSEAKQANNSIDISAENLAYLDENEPDEDLRNHINSLEDKILITAIDENGKKKAVGVGYFLDALGNKELKKVMQYINFQDQAERTHHISQIKRPLICAEGKTAK